MQILAKKFIVKTKKIEQNREHNLVSPVSRYIQYQCLLLILPQHLVRYISLRSKGYGDNRSQWF